MSLIVPKCIYCHKEILKHDQALVIVEYPKKKGFTEIKAYLHLEGKFVCGDCTNKLNIEGND